MWIDKETLVGFQPEYCCNMLTVKYLYFFVKKYKYKNVFFNIINTHTRLFNIKLQRGLFFFEKAKP